MVYIYNFAIILVNDGFDRVVLLVRTVQQLQRLSQFSFCEVEVIRHTLRGNFDIILFYLLFLFILFMGSMSNDNCGNGGGWGWGYQICLTTGFRRGYGGRGCRGGRGQRPCGGTGRGMRATQKFLLVVIFRLWGSPLGGGI